MEINKLNLFTSGTTGNPKLISLTEYKLVNASTQLWNNVRLNENDLILDCFPSNTIAHWIFVVYLQKISNCKVISIPFEPRKFWSYVFEYKPTFIPLAIRTLRTLFKLDVPYLHWKPQFLTGSAKVSSDDIQMILDKGASVVWNVYGSTEHPPPVFISKNDVCFDLSASNGYEIKFDNGGMLYVNEEKTGDIFNLSSGEFLKREAMEKNTTWKS
tara:strand:- start:1434 stop:2075 length:642 start_codon:yes stop_codon:yes gene_type:complete